jgi:hypothetical protein
LKELPFFTTSSYPDNTLPPSSILAITLQIAIKTHYLHHGIPTILGTASVTTDRTNRNTTAASTPRELQELQEEEDGADSATVVGRGLSKGGLLG